MLLILYNINIDNFLFLYFFDIFVIILYGYIIKIIIEFTKGVQGTDWLNKIIGIVLIDKW
jgi:hypothetical protein